MGHQVSDDGRGDAASDADTGKDDAIGNTALIARNPARDELVRRGVNDRFARTQQKPQKDQNHDGVRNAMGDGRGQSAENAPPQNSGSEHTARAEAVREPARWGLKQRVPPKKGAEDDSEANIAEAELLRNQAARNGEIDAIQIGDRAEYEQPENEQPADPGCVRDGHLVRGSNDPAGELTSIPKGPKPRLASPSFCRS